MTPAARDPMLAELLPYVLERCGHEPTAGADGLAICEDCAVVLVVLEGRVRERREETERLH